MLPQPDARPRPALGTMTQAVHVYRMEIVERQAEIGRIYEEWKAEHEELFKGLETAKGQKVHAENVLRAATVDTYLDDPDKNKKVAPGLGIREATTVEYNLETAIAWAQDNAAFILTLDKSHFEKVVKAGGVPERVATLTVTPTATIATDLGKVLLMDAVEDNQGDQESEFGD